MSDTIRISGLPNSYDEEDVFALCEEHGAVLDVGLHENHDDSLDAWVTFEDEWEAEVAANAMDGMVGQGFVLRVHLSNRMATA